VGNLIVKRVCGLLHWVIDGVPDRRHTLHCRETFSKKLGKLKENPAVELTPFARYNIGGANRMPPPQIVIYPALAWHWQGRLSS